MEALPDHQKSVRAIKRQAETNLIEGRYELSKKYLKLLQHTLYYSRWATLVLDLIDDEDAINSHPQWGAIRKMKPANNFMFSEGEKDMMLGLILTDNPRNLMARQYLSAYYMLGKDLDSFMKYLLAAAYTTGVMPLSYQETLFIAWEVTHTDMSGRIPYPVSDDVKSRFVRYARIYNATANPEPELRDKFSDTYWYYLHFRK